MVIELLARPLTAQNDTYKIPIDPPNWRRHYAYRLVVTDALVLCWAVFGAAHLSFDPIKPLVGAPYVKAFSVNYLVVSAVVVAIWMTALAAVGSRHYRVIGTGNAEFKAVLQSALFVLLLICLANFALKLDVSRRFVLVALPLGLLAIMISRVLWRRWLRLHRGRGLLSSRVLLVGSGETAAHIAAELRKHTAAGYHVVGVLVTDGRHALAGLAGLPVFSSVEHLLRAVSECRADTVFVTDGHNLPPSRLRELSWSLEPGRQHLVMAPSLTDIAGPRIHARPVAGLPLVHVETPRYEGVDRFLKRAFDIVVSSSLLLVLSVPLLVVAVADRDDLQGWRAVRPRAHRQARSAVQDAEVPLDGGRRRRPAGQSVAGAGNRRPAAVQGHQRSTNHTNRRSSCGATRSTRSPS